jgi:HEAT repeat protein
MKAAALKMWRQARDMVAGAHTMPEVYQTWVAQLASHDVKVQVPAIWALQQAGPAAIPPLVTGLCHADVRIRRNCVDIIDHGGYGADARCVAGLLPLLRDPVAHIRKAVWHTLFCDDCQQASQCAVPLVTPLDRVALLIEIGIHDPNPKLRQQCIADLLQLDKDPRAQQALAELGSRQGEGERGTLADRADDPDASTVSLN